MDQDRRGILLQFEVTSDPLNQIGIQSSDLFPRTGEADIAPVSLSARQQAADMWKQELGIPVEVRVGDEADLKKARLGDFHGEVLCRDIETRVDGSSAVRSSFGTPDHASRQTDDPAIFARSEEALGTIDPDMRHAAYDKLYRKLKVEKRYRLGPGYINLPWGVAPRVVEWSPFPMACWPSGLHMMALE